MKKQGLIVLICIASAIHATSQKPKVNVQQQFAFAAKQYEGMLATHTDTTQFPQSTKPDGSINNRKSSWWCSGFFAGSLWYLFEFTNDAKWKQAANKWTAALEKEKYNTGTHDLGFILNNSFGNAYRLTKNKTYIEPLLTGAKSLATRFNPSYGLIKSWNQFGDCNYPVIIDNMMNLEFLFWAAKQSHDTVLYNIAITHANNTINNHFRKDFSSYHVVCYEPNTTIFAKRTAQGANDTSAWARGQAWALYGYTMMYRETKNKKYLAQAEGIAKFIINHPNLPKDKIPYWDFNAPNIPNEERDASAAAITASALFELSTFSNNKKNDYFSVAEQILVSLSSEDYLAKEGQNNYFILKHSVGHKPANSEVDTPIIYADYYYLEALIRYNKLNHQQKL